MHTNYLGEIVINDADKSLVEASPDLLEAAKLALAVMEAEEAITEQWDEAWDALQDSIAKAERV